MPRLHRLPDAFADLGTVRIDGRLGIGEVRLEEEFAVRPGAWRVLFFDEEAVDALVDEGVLSEDDRNPAQLLLVHSDAPLPADVALPNLRRVAEVAIEAARFTAADAGLREVLATDDGFYDHLDGVEGLLENGRGVHVNLWGDGYAEVFLEDSPSPSMVLIELG
jgi:hypothetical protein